ncbi:PAS domain-containing protein [Acuticoccus mangrovi]|uniref:histidine kinase n=1 Tax=Acuticoccus mangrovi TaxID=2796142 RepID=A0A934MHJ9_9HYPH|nr:PAS domain-containing protein [Acuticoccus mangrovi]MBJ3776156.1 PAS domain-containing protein [Acuticoccus mangrovi]
MSRLNMHRMALERVPFSIVISNPFLEDTPIVFVNRAFTHLTGYSAEVSVGRNCRFLQGKDTEPEAIEAIRTAMRRREEVSTEILNYKADGTPFRNHVYIAPLNDPDGNLQFFIGLQRAVGAKGSEVVSDGIEEALREIHHRVKNHLSIVVGMIRMQARADKADSVGNYVTLARRIETLQFLYDEMTTGGTRRASDKDIALGAYVSRIASAIAYLDGRESVRLNLDLSNLHAPVDTAAQVGLLVSELLTNAYQHAFDDRAEGLIEVRLFELSGGVVRLQVIDDGVGLAEGSSWPDGGNLGGKIVRSLATGLDAELDVSGAGRGTTVTVDIPTKAAAPSDPSSGGSIADE